MNDLSQVEFSITKEEITRMELDQAVERTGQFLSIMDEAVSNATIDPHTRKISSPSQKRSVPEELKDMGEQYVRLVSEYTSKNMEYANKVRQVPGVLDVSMIAGSVVVVCDSSKSEIDQPYLHISRTSERGEHVGARKPFLGLVVVDINPDKRRRDGVSASTTLIHELRHHTQTVADFLFASNSHVQMPTGQREGPVNALFGRDQVYVPTGRVFNNAFMFDAEKYASLLGREVDESEVENIRLQLAYLAELHPSFLQRKENWFSADSEVYSSEKRKGKHWEMVGNNALDRQSAREVLAIIQACYLFDQFIIPDLRDQIAGENGLSIHTHTTTRKLVDEWENFFYQAGGIIGASRTVLQCQRLLSVKWDNFRNRYIDFFAVNKEKFDIVKNTWIDSGQATAELHQYI